MAFRQCLLSRPDLETSTSIAKLFNNHVSRRIAYSSYVLVHCTQNTPLYITLFALYAFVTNPRRLGAPSALLLLALH
jgi:hypothetical protein